MSNNQKTLAMIKGGKKLATVKKQLTNFALKTHSAEKIEELAVILIKKAGGKPSFSMVPNYDWATCINVNSGLVHGVPRGTFKKGDLVTIDIGMFYQGFHNDTSTTFVIGKPTLKQKNFLNIGKKTLKTAIAQARPGNKIKNISQKIQQGIEAAGYNVIRTLTGHGIGKELHQPPPIPCFVADTPEINTKISPNMALAIEVMYTQGSWPLELGSDGWTLTTKDGSLSAVFEETVLVTQNKPKVLTAINY